MTIKIAVSLPDELVRQARAAVAAGVAPSVSAYVAGAMAERSKRESLSVLLAEMDEELGAPTAAHRAWAREALGMDSA